MKSVSDAHAIQLHATISDTVISGDSSNNNNNDNIISGQCWRYLFVVTDGKARKYSFMVGWVEILLSLLGTAATFGFGSSCHLPFIWTADHDVP
jgi:hypothetical protein